MDSIGLGDSLASIIIGVCLSLSIGLFYFLIRKKSRYSLAWVSCSLNVISWLYFMGSTSYVISIFNIFIWPIINIILLIRLFLKKYEAR